MHERDRRTTLADAAITLLGTSGAKGLTHRAVDAVAGLPEGSTSFHCRTRDELVKLTLRRHAELDLADLQADAQAMQSGELTFARFLDVLLQRIGEWTCPPRRPHLLARFELLLMASRNPELAHAMSEQRQLFLQATAFALKRLGVPRPEAAAPRLVAAVDGILLDSIHATHVRGPAALSAALSQDEQRRLLQAAILADAAALGLSHEAKKPK